jgi:hypothetical protein
MPATKNQPVLKRKHIIGFVSVLQRRAGNVLGRTITMPEMLQTAPDHARKLFFFHHI